MKSLLLFLSISLPAVFHACDTPSGAKKTTVHPASRNSNGSRPVVRSSANTKKAPEKIPAGTTTSISWLESERLMPVLEMAVRDNKPVFMEFYAPWCAPCKVMEEEIFTRPTVAPYLNSNFLNFRTDFGSPAGRTIADIYEVSKLPTVLFMTPNGVVLQRYTGMANPSVLKAPGYSALIKMGR